MNTSDLFKIQQAGNKVVDKLSTNILSTSIWSFANEDESLMTNPIGEVVIV